MRMSELALYETSHLAEIISTIEAASATDLARLLITLVQGIIDCAPDGIPEPTLDRLWRMSPVAGAAFDTYRTGDKRCAGRWLSFTGWDPSARSNQEIKSDHSKQPPFGGGPIRDPIHTSPPSNCGTSPRNCGLAKSGC